MSPLDNFVSFAALAAASVASPAQAAPGRPPWARFGDWRINVVAEGVCSAEREYASGSRVFVTNYGPRGASLAVVNRAWSMQTPTAYGLSLVRGGVRQVFAADANPYAQGLGMSADDGARFLAQLAMGGIVEVNSPEGIMLERLDLNGLAPALAQLGPCISEAATAANLQPVVSPPPPAPPRWGRMRPARSPVPLASLFSSADYPAAAVRAGEAGTVAFRIEVGTNGRVTACTVIASSGSLALDSTTCRLIAIRARFQPARDRRGKPTRDSFTGRIIWSLPEPEPVPPPSP